MVLTGCAKILGVGKKTIFFDNKCLSVLEMNSEYKTLQAKLDLLADDRWILYVVVILISYFSNLFLFTSA